MELVTRPEIKGKNRNLKLEQVYALDNLYAAYTAAANDKTHTYGVRKFNEDFFGNIQRVQRSLMKRTYRHSKPKIENLLCPCGKVRRLTKLPFFDHVVHHALMNVIYPVMHKSYYVDSYASIKGRGIHYGAKRVREYIDNHKYKQLYSAQLDLVKFYGTVNQQICYDHLCRMYHDEGIRWLIREVLTVEEVGLGIGLFPIQPFCNFLLNPLDRFIGQKYGKKVKNFRYCDNIQLVSHDKKLLWDAVNSVIKFIKDTYGQEVHTNIGVRPITNETPLDFVGYLFYKDYTKIRKKMKFRFKRKFRRLKDEEHKRGMTASYMGWLMHCNGKHLFQSVTGLRSYEDFKVNKKEPEFDAEVISCFDLVNKDFRILDHQENVKTRHGKNRFVVLIELDNIIYKFFTNNKQMKRTLRAVKEHNDYPFEIGMISEYVSPNKVQFRFAI